MRRAALLPLVGSRKRQPALRVEDISFPIGRNLSLVAPIAFCSDVTIIKGKNQDLKSGQGLWSSGEQNRYAAFTDDKRSSAAEQQPP